MSQGMRRSPRKKLNGGDAVCSVSPFDITSLESEVLTRLFKETTSYMHNIRIEVVASGRGHQSKEEHPATTIGLTVQKPTIQFADSLTKGNALKPSPMNSLICF